MKKLISSTEAVDTLHSDSGEWEVCAAAEANYNDSDSCVVIELNSFLRKASMDGLGEVRHLPWLPGKSTVIEHAPREEASQIAHDVFASWVRKVRNSIPAQKTRTSSAP